MGFHHPSCAHCGEDVWTFDQCRFGEITLHKKCLAKFKAEHPGFNAPKSTSAPTTGACAFCCTQVPGDQAAHVDGHLVHDTCVRNFRQRKKDEAQAQAVVDLGSAILKRFFK